jgi:hypothetical protein
MYSHPLASHVHDHHYDLVGPDGVILPRLWEESIRPNWSVSMHIWPLEGFPLPQFGPPRIVPSPSAHGKLSPPSAQSGSPADPPASIQASKKAPSKPSKRKKQHETVIEFIVKMLS